MNTNHAEDIAREHEEGRARAKRSRTEQERAAQRIQAILALAEDAAKQGNEAERDRLLERASAMQLQFAIDETMLRQETGEGAEEIAFLDFCTESNTPLIKAKRELITTVALHARGRAVMMPEWKTTPKGLKLDRRAKIRVWAHRSDLNFINALYTSLLMQMQTMMAADEERVATTCRHCGGPLADGPDPELAYCTICVTSYARKFLVASNAWRVSYAHGWVNRVHHRLAEIRRRQEASATTSEPGTALVLRDRTALVVDHVTNAIGKTAKTSYRTNDTDAAGKQAGYAAGGRADLGQRGVPSAERPQLGA